MVVTCVPEVERKAFSVTGTVGTRNHKAGEQRAEGRRQKATG